MIKFDYRPTPVKVFHNPIGNNSQRGRHIPMKHIVLGPLAEFWPIGTNLGGKLSLCILDSYISKVQEMTTFAFLSSSLW